MDASNLTPASPLSGDGGNASLGGVAVAALDLAPDAPLPDDVPTLQAMVRLLLAEVARLREENAALKGRLEQLLKHQFGRRSERQPRTGSSDKKEPRKRHKHGRRQLPANLERRDVIHDLNDDEKPCPCCGKMRECIGQQETEQLEMEPIRFFVLRTIKKTYACKHCQGQPSQPPPQAEPADDSPPQSPAAAEPTASSGPAEPPPQPPSSAEPAPLQKVTQQAIPATLSAGRPQPCSRPAPVPASAGQARRDIQTAGPGQVGPIAKGLCGPGLLAWVITAKFADHTPVHRMAGQLQRSGVVIARSTLGGWLAQAALLLEPLYKFMLKRVLLSRVIHSDDTGVKMRVEGKKETVRAHMWEYIGDADYPYVVFDFTKDYTKEGPERMLKGYMGYVQADGLAQYEGLFGPGKASHVCCGAHARRRFVAALEGGDVRAQEALELFRQLFAIERALPELLPPSDDPVKQEQRHKREEERKRIRQQQSVPILDKLKKWLELEKPKVLPKSALGEAIGYALNNWEALRRYVDQGYLAIDNNLSERILRVVALGRGNWGVVGSETGGKTAAVLYSIVQTCKHLNIDPYAYLKEALAGLFALGEKPADEQLVEWLPDRWLNRKKQAAPVVANASG
jgi:transposase